MTERERLIKLLMQSRIYLSRVEAEVIADDICFGGVKLPVQCGECEHYSAERKDDKYGVCRYWQYYMEAPEVCADDYCCHGERREVK